METILLFGGGLQVLSLSKGLCNGQYKIVNAAFHDAVGRFSKYVTKFIPIYLDTITLQEIEELIRVECISVIIPTEDEYAEWLSKNKYYIEHNTKALCAVADNPIFKQVINKSSLLSLCQQFGIPHPKTISIDIKNIDEISRSIEYPALIKPDRSNGSRGINIVNSQAEFKEKAIGIIEQYGASSIQEFINNPNHYYNAMLYRYEDATYNTSVVTKITRFYPIKGGSSSFCTSVENQKIIDICKRLLDKLNWVGFADFDILEKDNGDYRIIEINPRVPASLHAALVSGINFGEVIVSDLTGKPRPNQKYIPGAQLRFLGLDIAWFISSPERFRIRPSWFKFFGKRLYYQEGGLQDWKAMAYSIWSGVRKQLSPSFRKSKSGMN